MWVSVRIDSWPNKIAFTFELTVQENKQHIEKWCMRALFGDVLFFFRFCFHFCNLEREVKSIDSMAMSPKMEDRKKDKIVSGARNWIPIRIAIKRSFRRNGSCKQRIKSIINLLPMKMFCFVSITNRFRSLNLLKMIAKCTKQFYRSCSPAIENPQVFFKLISNFRHSENENVKYNSIHLFVFENVLIRKLHEKKKLIITTIENKYFIWNMMVRRVQESREIE